MDAVETWTLSSTTHVLDLVPRLGLAGGSMLPPILYVNLYQNSAGGGMLPPSGILNQHSVILQY